MTFWEVNILGVDILGVDILGRMPNVGRAMTNSQLMNQSIKWFSKIETSITWRSVL